MENLVAALVGLFGVTAGALLQARGKVSDPFDYPRGKVSDPFDYPPNTSLGLSSEEQSRSMENLVAALVGLFGVTAGALLQARGKVSDPFDYRLTPLITDPFDYR